jgi:hypothetical protein
VLDSVGISAVLGNFKKPNFHYRSANVLTLPVPVLRESMELSYAVNQKVALDPVLPDSDANRYFAQI